MANVQYAIPWSVTSIFQTLCRTLSDPTAASRFPISPIAFTFSANSSTYNSVYSRFMIWEIKELILRPGGLHTYRRLIPLFIGMMVGYLAGVGTGIVVDFLIFSGQGHH